MSAGEVHENDIGTIFQVTVTDQDGVAVDISSATVRKIYFTKPNGKKLEKTASLVNSGTDGKMKYTSIADDLDITGTWSIQGYVETAGGKWSTDISEFTVYKNL